MSSFSSRFLLVALLLVASRRIVRWVGSLAIRKLVVSCWRGFAMEVFASRPPLPSRRERCSSLGFCLCSSLHVATWSCDLLTSFVGYDFAFLRLSDSLCQMMKLFL
ncbi:hypothetical protein L2E82_35831 [Cichorium intybus]|uniref:Uncharacterized protein n=1 Tax=Cichorium intybus TaxID=13427 RepID=A0ACB9BPV4_CICIN|nr:hypothetical protein L2E82_35831 [Cichorium intybus]